MRDWPHSLRYNYLMRTYVLAWIRLDNILRLKIFLIRCHMYHPITFLELLHCLVVVEFIKHIHITEIVVIIDMRVAISVRGFHIEALFIVLVLSCLLEWYWFETTFFLVAESVIDFMDSLLFHIGPVNCFGVIVRNSSNFRCFSNWAALLMNQLNQLLSLIVGDLHVLSYHFCFLSYN